MVKKVREFTPAGVLAYITENRGIRYQNGQLARVFKVKTKAMMPVLAELFNAGSILSTSSGKYRFYYLLTPEEIALNARMKEAPAFHEMKNYDAKLNNFRALCMETRK